MASTNAPANAPTRIGVVLFPGFQLIDICGPLDVLNILSTNVKLDLTILAATPAPVSTKHHMSSVTTGSNFSESIVPTHTFANAPDDLEVLILPGGFGARKEENTDDVVNFFKGYWGKGSLKYILTVCTGSAILAKTGILDGKRATSNKKAFAWVSSSLLSLL
jgi:putative intracellular protease/amidase